MSDIVVESLQALGPCASTELAAHLVKVYGLRAENARQRISRSKAVKKLAHITLPHKARFVYLQSTYGSPEFWRNLVEALLKDSKSFGGAIAALIARGGVMPASHFHIACGAPKAQKGHVSASGTLERLQAAKLVSSFEAVGIGPCVQLAQAFEQPEHVLAAMRARIRTEDILLTAVKDWARNLGIVSYNSVALRDEGGEQPRVATFHWDLVGPSYLDALIEYGKDSKKKPGFLVCDVLLNPEVDVQALQPFLRKCQTLRSLKNVGRCIHIFVANRFSKDAYGLAKEKGIIPATTSSLFGEDIARALKDLVDLLSSVYPKENAVEKVDEVFKRLSQIEGTATNLRGALFEFVVAEAVRLSSPYTSITLNQTMRDENGQKAEVDVLVYHQYKSVRFIECKGYKPGGTVPDEMVERWLKNRVPLIRKIALAKPEWQNLRLEFEFWTSGRVSDEARKMITEAAQQTHRYGIHLVDRDELEQRVADTNNTSLKDTVEQHFIGHALERAEREADRKAQTAAAKKQNATSPSPTAAEQISVKVLTSKINSQRETAMVQPMLQLGYTKGPDTRPEDEG